MVYLSEIVMALDDYSGFGSYVYDRETDRVEMLFDSMDPEVMEEDESGRYVTVCADSNLGYDAMVGLGLSIIPVGMGFASATINPFTVGVAQALTDVPLFSGLAYRFFEDAAREWCEDNDVPIS